ncbi:hypothetical protein JCM33374_g1657 [Metschnikowia sp. JCM 33374]|nr:hypothetical protein JCM33374_g1657 [Metschnikowia sp. JCM 33374]
MKYLIPLFLCLSMAFAESETKEFDGKQLYPSLRTFASKEALVESYLWNYFTNANNDINALTTALYMEDTETILVVSTPEAKGFVRTSKELLGLSNPKTVYMTEIDLGSNVYSVGSDYFPLVTVSSEYSTGGSMIEREITDSYRITFSPSVERKFNFFALTITATLGLNLGAELSERESIVCMANPGGKVQFQVSNRILHFPNAKIRNLQFSIKEKEFVEQEWEMVKSSVDDEEHVGALFYDRFKLGKNRCVTDPAQFQDIRKRKWLEWSKPYSEKE